MAVASVKLPLTLQHLQQPPRPTQRVFQAAGRLRSSQTPCINTKDHTDGERGCSVWSLVWVGQDHAQVRWMASSAGGSPPKMTAKETSPHVHHLVRQVVLLPIEQLLTGEVLADGEATAAHVAHPGRYNQGVIDVLHHRDHRQILPVPRVALFPQLEILF